MCEKRSARVENVQICAGGCLAGGGGGSRKNNFVRILRRGGSQSQSSKMGGVWAPLPAKREYPYFGLVRVPPWGRAWFCIDIEPIA